MVLSEAGCWRLGEAGTQLLPALLLLEMHMGTTSFVVSGKSRLESLSPLVPDFSVAYCVAHIQGEAADWISEVAERLGRGLGGMNVYMIEFSKISYD